jgi:hypothetical protein
MTSFTLIGAAAALLLVATPAMARQRALTPIATVTLTGCHGRLTEPTTSIEATTSLPAIPMRTTSTARTRLTDSRMRDPDSAVLCADTHRRQPASD